MREEFPYFGEPVATPHRADPRAVFGVMRSYEGAKMAHTIHYIGVASQIGAYSDSIEAGSHLRWLIVRPEFLIEVEVIAAKA